MLGICIMLMTTIVGAAIVSHYTVNTTNFNIESPIEVNPDAFSFATTQLTQGQNSSIEINGINNLNETLDVSLDLSISNQNKSILSGADVWISDTSELFEVRDCMNNNLTLECEKYDFNNDSQINVLDLLNERNNLVYIKLTNDDGEYNYPASLSFGEFHYLFVVNPSYSLPTGDYDFVLNIRPN